MIRIIKFIFLAVCFISVAQAQDIENTVYNPDQAASVPEFTHKEIQCLAQNIFHEAANESEEGMVAVGLVTINRANSPDYPDNLCSVVHQRSILWLPVRIVEYIKVRLNWFQTENQRVVKTVYKKTAVCQFSWSCEHVSNPKADDPRWLASQEIAQKLAEGGYPHMRDKFGDCKHFHSTKVHPKWHLKRVARVGNHIFYK